MYMKGREAEGEESGTSPSHDVLVKKHLDEWLDEALADTFPASDPIASAPSDDALLAHEEGEAPTQSRPAPAAPRRATP